MEPYFGESEFTVEESEHGVQSGGIDRRRIVGRRIAGAADRAGIAIRSCCALLKLQ